MPVLASTTTTMRRVDKDVSTQIHYNYLLYPHCVFSLSLQFCSHTGQPALWLQILSNECVLDRDVALDEKKEVTHLYIIF